MHLTFQQPSDNQEAMKVIHFTPVSSIYLTFSGSRLPLTKKEFLWASQHEPSDNLAKLGQRPSIIPIQIKQVVFRHTCGKGGMNSCQILQLVYPIVVISYGCYILQLLFPIVVIPYGCYILQQLYPIVVICPLKQYSTFLNFVRDLALENYFYLIRTTGPPSGIRLCLPYYFTKLKNSAGYQLDYWWKRGGIATQYFIPEQRTLAIVSVVSGKSNFGQFLNAVDHTCENDYQIWLNTYLTM